jgi:hypothetical protein
VAGVGSARVRLREKRDTQSAEASSSTYLITLISPRERECRARDDMNRIKTARVHGKVLLKITPLEVALSSLRNWLDLASMWCDDGEFELAVTKRAGVR